MSDIYLILHKVRGEPAFDIAEPLRCPKCQGDPQVYSRCDCDAGRWWIISTSGHRAFPYRKWDLEDLYDGSDMDMPKPLHVFDRVDPPEALPDHYPVNQPSAPATAQSGADLLEKLGL